MGEPDQLGTNPEGVTKLRYLIFGAFIATVFAANWAIKAFGPIPVGFGFVAPAGVMFAGLAFTFRDLLHEHGGRSWIFVAILFGATLSAVLEPRFAIASGVAFGLSELADWAVYEPMRRRGWLRAVLASNIVGLTVDSVLFLWLAFGSLDFLPGQLLAKFYMTALAVIVLRQVRRQWLRVEGGSDG